MSTPPIPTPLASDLTTLANVQAWLNVQPGPGDAILQRLLSAASVFAQTWMNRKIPVAQYTERYSGSGSNTLALANYPIQSVESVTIRDWAVQPSPDGIRSGFVHDDQFLYLIGMPGPANGPFNGAPNVFPKFPPRAIGITYTAGYETVPPDIEQAVLELIALKWADRSHFGQSSKSVGGEVVSYITADMPRGAATLLGNYKKVIPA